MCLDASSVLKYFLELDISVLFDISEVGFLICALQSCTLYAGNPQIASTVFVGR